MRTENQFDPVAALLREYQDLENSGARPALEDFLARCPENRRAELQEALETILNFSSARTQGNPQFDDFEIVREIGRGGSGVVYEAWQKSLGRRVALKMLSVWGVPSSSTKTRLLGEAKALAQLRHPNIVEVYAAGDQDGVPFLAMEYVEGITLDKTIRQARENKEPIAISQILRWIWRIACALDSAHNSGIVHRDVKPQNIMITKDGRALLMDFGLARQIESARLTKTGVFQGSPYYASPEQFASSTKPIDGRSDIYSLGITLYECATGTVPFSAVDPERILHQVILEEPLPPRKIKPAISRDLETVILHAIEKQPSRRYPSAAAFAKDLEALLEMRPIQARPSGTLTRSWKWVRRRPATGIAIALGLLLIAMPPAFLLWQRGEEKRERMEKAASLFQEAQRRFEEYRTHRNRLRAIETLETQEENERERLQLRQEMEPSFFRILNLLSETEALGPDRGKIRQMRAELYMEKWRESLERNEERGVALYQELVESNDDRGEFTKELRGLGSLRIHSTVSRAEVHLFRFVRHSDLAPGGDLRLVPIPLRSAARHWAGGSKVLRATRNHAPLEKGDLVIEVAGQSQQQLWDLWQSKALSGQAKVLRDGELYVVEIPVDAPLRPTAIPAPISGETLLGHTPFEITALEPGPYLAALRSPRGEEVSISFAVGRLENKEIQAVFAARPSGPPGFVFVHGGVLPKSFEPGHPEVAREIEGFWIQEAETSAEEYLEFLNEPETLRQIRASEKPIHYPRNTKLLDMARISPSPHSPRESLWDETPEGKFAIPQHLQNRPVLGISFEDVLAFLAWKNERAQRERSPWRYALPTHGQWTIAAVGTDGRALPFGARCFPGWTDTLSPRPVFGPHPLFQFPLDESPYHVYGCAGGVSEYCSDYRRDGFVGVRGGNWLLPSASDPAIYQGQGIAGSEPFAFVGFRMVAKWED